MMNKIKSLDDFSARLNEAMEDCIFSMGEAMRKFMGDISEIKANVDDDLSVSAMHAISAASLAKYTKELEAVLNSAEFDV